jgi:hypothetical protein|tara:strand:+ start:2213 stop:2635 length:423 start_codon:yes stop_codon:yes gene_type:complete
MKNILMYWPNFFTEAWFTIKYYKAVKSIKAELLEANLRVDWIGRIYTIVNLKDEFLNQPEVVQQSFVFQQLGPINKILVKYGLSNDAFPEISKISEESYLVVLYPENDDFNIISFIRNILFAGLVGGAVFGIVQLVKLFV